jgi:hypothetical protein
MVTLQSIAGAVITEPPTCKEKQGTPVPLDRFEKEIGINAQEIEIVFLPNVPVRIISFEF